MVGDRRRPLGPMHRAVGYRIPFVTIATLVNQGRRRHIPKGSLNVRPWTREISSQFHSVRPFDLQHLYARALCTARASLWKHLGQSLELTKWPVVNLPEFKDSYFLWSLYRPCAYILHFCVTYGEEFVYQVWHMTGFQLLWVNHDGCHMWGQEMFTLSGTPDSHPFIIYIYITSFVRS